MTITQVKFVETQLIRVTGSDLVRSHSYLKSRSKCIWLQGGKWDSADSSGQHKYKSGTRQSEVHRSLTITLSAKVTQQRKFVAGWEMGY